MGTTAGGGGFGGGGNGTAGQQPKLYPTTIARTGTFATDEIRPPLLYSLLANAFAEMLYAHADATYRATARRLDAAVSSGMSIGTPKPNLHQDHVKLVQQRKPLGAKPGRASTPLEGEAGCLDPAAKARRRRGAAFPCTGDPPLRPRGTVRRIGAIRRKGGRLNLHGFPVQANIRSV